MQVIKVGTSSLIREETHSINLTNVAKICDAVRQLLDQGSPPATNRAPSAPVPYLPSVPSSAVPSISS